MYINQKIFIIIIVILLIYLIYIQLYNNIENFTTTSTSNEALQTISSVFNNGNMTLTNLTTTGNITTNGTITSTGNVTSSSFIASGPNASFLMKDRKGNDFMSAWYANDGIVKLWTNTNGDIISIDKVGNINTSGNINTTGLKINNNQWQPDYFRFQCQCNTNNCYYAPNASTIASGPISSNTGDNAKWYWIGNRLFNKQFGTCLQDDGSGNFSLGSYDPANKWQMFIKNPTGASYKIAGFGCQCWLGGWQSNNTISRYGGSNGGDCNYYFYDIV